MSRNRILPILTAAVLLIGAAWPGPPAFQVVVFAAMTAALWGTGARIARWLVPDWNWLSYAVAAFSFTVAVAVVPATWMGHFGVMRAGLFLAWTAVAYLLSLLLPVQDVAAVPAETVASESPPRENTERAEAALMAALAAAITLVGLRDVFRLRFAPAGAYSFDDISYHLAAVATWIRHGDLRMMRFAVGDASTPFYPVLSEVAAWVLFAPFRDNDVAARWMQIPFGLFSILAVAAIARRLGLSYRLSALAALLFASFHRAFPLLLLTAGNDHSASFFTLAAVDAGLALMRRPRPGAAVAAGSTLGLLLATKYIGVLYAPVVLLVLGLAWLAERREPGSDARVPARVAAGLLGLLAAALTVTAGYTYLRNAVTTGNPIFPAPLRLFGIEIFPGWESASIAHRDDSPEFRINVWRFLTRRKDLFGPFFPLTLLPAALAAPFVALWRKPRRHWTAALVFTLPILFFLEFLFLMHDHRDMRYFLPGVALAAVAFAWLVDWAGRWTLPFSVLLLAVMTYQAARRLGMDDTKEVLLTLALFGLGVLAERGRWWESGRKLVPQWRWAAALAVLVLALPLGWLAETYQEVMLIERPAAFALESLAGPDGGRVAYVGLNQPYPFFGRRLQNGVQIVPRNWHLDAQYYRWGSPVTDPFVPETYRRWRRILRRLGIQWVVVARTPWNDPERTWIGQRPRDFRLAYQDADAEIWKVLLPAESGEGGPAGPGRRAGGEESKPESESGSRSPARDRRAPG